MLKKVKVISEVIELGDTPRKEFGIQDVGLGMIKARMNNKVLHIREIVVPIEDRQNGKGSKALNDIINQYPDHLIYLASGDIEDEGKNLNNKLKLLEQFYTKNGFKNVNDKIGQYEFKESFIALNEPGKKLINSLYS